MRSQTGPVPQRPTSERSPSGRPPPPAAASSCPPAPPAPASEQHKGQSHGQLRETRGQLRERVVVSSGRKSWSTQGDSHGQLREKVTVSSGRIREKVMVSSGRVVVSSGRKSWSTQGGSHGQPRERAVVSSVCSGTGLSWHIMSSNNGCLDFLFQHMNNNKGEYHHWLVLLWTGRGASGHPTTAVCSNLSGLPADLFTPFFLIQ